MTDDNLTDLLDRAGEQIGVREVPLAEVRAAAADRSRRRRSRYVMAVSAAAVAAAIVGSVLVVDPDSSKPDSSDTPATRLFGLGHVAVEVPASWATGDTHCGTPLHDTVTFDVGGLSCSIRRPQNVEMMGLRRANLVRDFEVDQEYEIDGVNAQREAVSCLTSRDSERVQCETRVFLPTERVLVTLSSSTSRERLEEMLTWIQVRSDRVAVPYFDMNIEPSSGLDYEGLLRSSGLTVERIRDFDADGPTGLITDVQPAPGTVVAPGTTVTFSVVSRRSNPDVRATLRLSVQNPEDATQTFANQQIRAGMTLVTAPGARISLFATGAESTRVRVDTDRAHLQPQGPHHFPAGGVSFRWTPVFVGRTTMTVYVVANGEQVTLGEIVLDIRTHT